jgi:hypothetical protein
VVAVMMATWADWKATARGVAFSFATSTFFGRDIVATSLQRGVHKQPAYQLGQCGPARCRGQQDAGRIIETLGIHGITP